MSDTIEMKQMPVLALRGLTVFPKQLVHFDVGREKSLKALERAMKENQRVFLVTQKRLDVDDPQEKDLFPVGVVAQIKQMLTVKGDLVRVLVYGEYRGKLHSMARTEPYLAGNITELQEESAGRRTAWVDAYVREAIMLFDRYLEVVQHPAQEAQLQILTSQEPGFVADTIAQNVTIPFDAKARILGMLSPMPRLVETLHQLQHEIRVLELESELHEKTKEQLDQGQRDYFLREQLRIIRSELGEDEEDDEGESYKRRVLALKLEKTSEEKLLKDVSRMIRQPFGSQEGAVLRNYLDAVLELPWNKRTKERLDLNAAAKILDADHFGMEKVKERILEVLAVKQMAPQLPGQIICLVGPPGVGKTSIAYSIARALGRKMARISLGGVHDEAEIRGHRKTYVGSMPGRIMSAMTQAGVKNPLLLLDEVDKLGSDHRGDPSSALLEVLDSEQNATYRDHYVEIPFDLSECMFITTANRADTIPRPLLDRMEVIELSSYTDEEKLMIAKNHLLPKQLKRHGLKKAQLRISDDCLREIISCYTRESGVRNLERQLAALCRKADRRFVEDGELKRVTVNGGNLEEYLGVRRYLPDQLPPEDSVGLVTGLAWTAVGGEPLEVEVNVMPGTGRLELTGNLGDVMKESAHAALSYIRSQCGYLGIDPEFYKNRDIHVHFPEGAVPKDGPSAGITVCTAMVSALTGIPVRRDIAMTGEISLRGRVMAIGGLKEKTMAALRHGIKTVIIPEDNRRDLEEIDQTVRKSLNFITARHVRTVLEVSLVRELPWENPAPVEQRKPMVLGEKLSQNQPDICQ